MDILLQLKKWFISPKVEYNIKIDSESDIDINFALVMKLLGFLVSKKRSKMILYFHDIESCNEIKKILKYFNISIIRDINTGRKKYKARMVLLKNVSYNDLLKQSLMIAKYNKI